MKISSPLFEITLTILFWFLYTYVRYIFVAKRDTHSKKKIAMLKFLIYFTPTKKVFFLKEKSFSFYLCTKYEYIFPQDASISNKKNPKLILDALFIDWLAISVDGKNLV